MANDPTHQVDILITHDVGDFKSDKFHLGKIDFKVISKADLIKMKKNQAVKKI